VARSCEVCGKGPRFGNQVSHSNIKTRKKWSANAQTVRVKTAEGVKRLRVCTSCLRSGKVEKAPRGYRAGLVKDSKKAA